MPFFSSRFFKINPMPSPFVRKKKVLTIVSKKEGLTNIQGKMYDNIYTEKGIESNCYKLGTIVRVAEITKFDEIVIEEINNNPDKTNLDYKKYAEIKYYYAQYFSAEKISKEILKANNNVIVKGYKPRTIDNYLSAMNKALKMQVGDVNAKK